MFCPFLETGNKECRKVHTLKNLSSAVHLCSGNYRICPIYTRLRAKESRDLIPIRA